MNPAKPGLTGARFLELVRPGLVVHARGRAWFSSKIRAALNSWQKRLCEELGVPYETEEWGSHDGLIVRHPDTGDLCVGEALISKGSTLTPIVNYSNAIEIKGFEVRLLAVIDATPEMESCASDRWIARVWGRPYDLACIPRLIIKSYLGDWSEIVPDSWLHRWMKKIGDKAAGWRWATWCTEGVADAWDKNIWQSNNPTPLTTEHIAGWLPRRLEKKITLRELE